MTVKKVDFGNRVCSICHKRKVTCLCDFVVAYENTPFFRSYLQVKESDCHITCDVAMCDECAEKQGQFDFCPAHAKLLKHIDDGLTQSQINSRKFIIEDRMKEERKNEL